MRPWRQSSSTKKAHAIASLAVLKTTVANHQLAKQLIDLGAVPKTEPEDALHIALATLVQMDYIVSWNFAHLVGVSAKLKLNEAIKQLGLIPPKFATPEDLLLEIG
jgi:hypothetical protein